ncbi:uncharacterized protein Dwil_GK19637 [Drosophila willistoni]|uniref:Deltamethrin resistance protein prag01 domain-containing protein n=1 Tax=Drosophila willistoni TaxID=7260 RepID=B4MNT2_DROWI|nr:vicilin-like seed storage protein At2g18540 [Drosophila willistoni]EDW73771.1 uncharacterized protein Dwil_GK19637 [Drosophila willistoni]
MSRILFAATARFVRNICNGEMFHNMTQRISTGKFKSPFASNRSQPKGPQASTAPKCPGAQAEVPKLKPGYFPSGGMHAVFSDLPQPEGDFFKAWNAKNSKYNMVLLSGVVALCGAIALSVTTGLLNLYWAIPEYPYNPDEMEDFAAEEERRQQEKEEREQRHQDRVEAKELSERRRAARDNMAREKELMEKDMDEGISDAEMEELQRLGQEREEFNKWETEEMKRIEEKEKEREKIRKEKDKIRAEKEKEREKKEQERDKQLEKEEKEREKQREKARKEREKQRKEEEREAEKAKKAQRA